MNEREARDPRPGGYRRAKDEQEPGAHSGAESQARDRVVPGTASAREGYQSQGGTAHGEPLSGVEAHGEKGRMRPSGGKGTPEAGPVRRARTDSTDATEDTDQG